MGGRLVGCEECQLDVASIDTPPVGTGRRAWRDYSEPLLPPILHAALECFVEHGYHGTTIRTVAARAGLSVPGLYHHYPSKQALLVSIVRRAMEDLFDRSQAAVLEAGPWVEARFRALIECLVLFHAHRSKVAFISASEIRSLEGHAREELIGARDRQQRLLDDIVVQGAEEGIFATTFPRQSSRAIVTMCTGVAQWYDPAGKLTPEELASNYVTIARAAVDG